MRYFIGVSSVVVGGIAGNALLAFTGWAEVTPEAFVSTPILLIIGFIAGHSWHG